MFDDGTDEDGADLPDHDTVYEENSPARCRSCGHDDAWGNFTVDGLDSLLAANAKAQEVES